MTTDHDAPSPDLLAAAFPGQGAQSAGMGSALAAASPAARQVFRAASAHLGHDVLAMLADPQRIDDLEVMGVATLACSVAAHAAATEAGAQADLVLGHSLGEYAAFVAAEVIGFGDALDLVALRARVTAEQAARTPGAMSALIGIGWAQAHELAAGLDEVWVANDNHPGQVVVSGVTASVAALEERARERGVRVQRLAVAGAFHCPLMEPAARQMEQALAGVRLRAPSRIVVSTTTAAAEYDPQALAQILVSQLTGPVRFTEAVSLAWRLGARRILECGSKPVLVGLVRRMPDPWQSGSVSDQGLRLVGQAAAV